LKLKLGRGPHRLAVRFPVGPQEYDQANKDGYCRHNVAKRTYHSLRGAQLGVVRKANLSVSRVVSGEYFDPYAGGNERGRLLLNIDIELS
jgi:hypothetical protein